MNMGTNQRSKRSAVIAAGLLALLLHGTSAAARGRKNLVTPYVTGHEPSPDRKYSITEIHDDGDTTTIKIVEVKTGKTLLTEGSVDTYYWVPGSGHRLVVATSGMYGAAMLAMWEGGIRWRGLHPVRRPAEEWFTIYRVSRDGRYLIYGHTPDYETDDKAIERRHRLRLPPP